MIKKRDKVNGKLSALLIIQPIVIFVQFVQDSEIVQVDKNIQPKTITHDYHLKKKKIYSSHKFVYTGHEVLQFLTISSSCTNYYEL